MFKLDSFKNKIYIGDNLSIMKSQDFQHYYEKVDFIYIDPPYNTCNSFSYSDKNINWDKDIKKRLKIAYKLLSRTGIIFISIDDNKLANLLIIANKIFGKNNFAGIFITKQSQRSNAKHINIIHEYILAFAKDKVKLQKFYIKRIEDPNESVLIKNIIKKIRITYNKSKKQASTILKKMINNYVLHTGQTWIKNYNNISDDGRVYFAKDLSTPGKPAQLDIDEINLHLQPLKTRGWSSKKKIIDLYNKKRLVFKNGRPYSVEYLDEATNNVSSILDFYSRFGTNDLKKLGLDGLFDTPKPVELIKYLIRISQHKDALILDFYAGSGTTGQAVYEVNNEDNTNHKYILIQIDEKIKKNTDAYNFLIDKGISVPKISDVLLYRINTYLKINNHINDFDIIYN